MFYVFSRVYIAVVYRAAYRAGPFPYGQVPEFRVLIPAVPAHLAAGVPPAHLYEHAAVYLQLVLEHPKEHAVGVVMDRLPVVKPAVRHGLQVKVLHTDTGVLFGYRSRLLVQEVLPLVCHMGMDTRKAYALFIAVL